MFWNKKTKVVLDCFTNVGSAALDYPIEKASNFIPTWWKTLPRYNTAVNNLGVEIQIGTMKGCLGFVDLYASGFVMPLWSDLNLKIKEGDFAYQFATKSNAVGGVTTHNPSQYNERFKNHMHFKIITPWLFSEKSGIPFFLTPCSWTSIEETPKFSFLNGIARFNLQRTCNLNGFALQENLPYQYNLKAGFPLLHLIPITEKDVSVKIHHVDKNEWEKLISTSMPNKFYSWGINKRKIYNQKSGEGGKR